MIVGPHVRMRFDVHGSEGALGWDFERMNELERFRPSATTRATRASRPARGIPASSASSRAPACRWATTTCACSRRRTSSPRCATASNARPGLDEMVATARVLATIERSAAQRCLGAGMRVANAPLSYGAFEMTVGTDFPVPEPARVLEAMAAAGYAGTELGPPGYLGGWRDLALEGRPPDWTPDLAGLELVGGFVQIAFSDPHAGLEELHATLDRFGEAKRRAAGPVRRGRPGADRQPRAAAARTPRCGSTSRAGACSSTASRVPPTRRARAASSRSSITTRRPTSRASRRSIASSRRPTCRCCSTAGTCSSPAATRCRRSPTGATGSRPSTSRTCGSTCSRASRPSAPTR